MRRFDLRQLDPNTPDGVARLNEVLEAVGEGGLVAFPSPTGWRLGTCSRAPDRIARLLELAERPAERPLAYLIPSLGILESLFEEAVPRGLEALGVEVWPGTTTVVVEAHAAILPHARRQAPGVALRIPHDPLLRRLMAGLPPLAQVRAAGGAREHVEALAGHLDVLLELAPAPPAGPGRVLYLRGDGSTQVLRG